MKQRNRLSAASQANKHTCAAAGVILDNSESYFMSEKNLYRPTDHFLKKMASVRQSDPPGYKRVQQVVERLLEEPNDADGKMHGLYQGRYKKYVGRREYRIIYYWCKVCRKENRRLQQECDDCRIIPDNTVIFFDLYHKNEMKKFKKNT